MKLVAQRCEHIAPARFHGLFSRGLSSPGACRERTRMQRVSPSIYYRHEWVGGPIIDPAAASARTHPGERRYDRDATMISDESVMVTFGLAGPADADRVVGLVESAYRGEASRAGWTTEADLLGGQRTDRAEVEALLEDPSVTIVLGSIRAHGRIELAGTICVRVDSDAVAHIGMFAVRPTLQSGGVGGALLREAERVARQRGARWAEMTVIEQRQELLAWYRRRGYDATGETEPFPYGNPRFGLPKRDDLRFLVLAKRLDA